MEQLFFNRPQVLLGRTRAMHKAQVRGSGIMALADIVQGLRLGDIVVYQIDGLNNCLKVVLPFVWQALQDRDTVICLTTSRG